MLKDKSIKSTVSIRSIAIGLILILINTYWIATIEMVWHSLHFTVASLPMNVVFILALLLWVNLLLKKYLPKWALSQSELLVIYVMLCITTAFSGHDNMVLLMGTLPHAFWFATPENDWAALFYQYLPKWLVVGDYEAARDFYEGNVSFFSSGHYRLWIIPILSWFVFIFLLIFIMLCLNVIIRRQWAEQEKLSYPIIQLAYQMTGERRGILKRRLFWVGFLAAALIDVLNGLNFIWPQIPHIPIKDYDLINYITEKPWSAVGSMPIRFYPYVTGLCFLMPLDLSFSCWFFYLFGKAQLVFGSAMGVHAMPAFPYFSEQSTGALFGVCLLAIWLSRLHLIEVFKLIFGLKSRYDTSDEPMSYRTAAICIILSFSLLFLFCYKAGMSPWIIVIFFGVYYMVAVAITRMRAEAGVPVHAVQYVNPQSFLITTLGTKRLGAMNLTMLALFYWFNRFNRSHPMPHQLEGFRLAELAKIDNRRLMYAMIIAMVFGIMVTLWIFPYDVYKHGAASRAAEVLATGWVTYNSLESWLTYPRPPDNFGIAFMVAGFIFTFFLMLMRMKFVWFPLHPVGYALGIGSSTIDFYWVVLVVTSIAKWQILKHGGVGGYRKAVPFFLGLIIGESIVACLWALISVIVNQPLYVAWI